MQVLCHPDHKQLLARMFGEAYQFDKLAMFNGIEFRFNRDIPKYEKKWVFPVEKFWEYEPSDEAWCRKLGIGHEEDDLKKPVMWMISM